MREARSQHAPTSCLLIARVVEFVCHPKDVGVGKVTAVKAFKYLSRDRGLSEPQDVAKSDLAIKTMLEAQDWVRTRLPGLKGARIKSILSYW